MFSTAKVIAPAAKTTKAKAENQLEGLEQLAQVDALIKSLEAVKATLDAEVKSRALNIFIETANGRRPESFRGLEGTASASIELRKRSTTSPLNEDQIKLLASKGVAGEKVIVTNKMFGINPVHAENQELLAKVEAALKDIVPADFIVLQEEKSKIVVTDKAMETVFKEIHMARGAAKNKEEFAAVSQEARTFIETVGVLAIKPTLQSTDVASLFDKVRGYVVE